MDTAHFIHLLEEHEIRPTANRLLIASTLAGQQRPLSMKELEYKILSIDKSNIFRTLTLFRQQHLVHAIEDGDGTVKYEMCHSHHHGHDDDQHMHFYCESCHQTTCLCDISIPEVVLPEGYIQTTANFLVKGICPECAKKRSLSK